MRLDIGDVRVAALGLELHLQLLVAGVHLERGKEGVDGFAMRAPGAPRRSSRGAASRCSTAQASTRVVGARGGQTKWR